MTETSARGETHHGAQHFVRTVRELDPPGAEPRILVAGCGKAHEARYIHNELDGSLIGVDIGGEWDPDVATAPGLTLQIGSILDLPFEDGSFDAIFYHHVIEHVDDPAKSLTELARVLRPGGLIYVGTPNRHRAVGYVGSFDTKLIDKLRYNAKDYKDRLRGRFRNEYGAHAGFTQRELNSLLAKDFREVRSLTTSYFQSKYASLPKPALKALGNRAVQEVVVPAVYAVGRR